MKIETFNKAWQLVSRIQDIEDMLRVLKTNPFGIEKPFGMHRIEVPDEIFKRPLRQVYFLVRGYLLTELKKAKRELERL